MTSPQPHPEWPVDVVVGEDLSTLNGHLIGLWLGEPCRRDCPAFSRVSDTWGAVRDLEWMLAYGRGAVNPALIDRRPR